MKLNYFVFVFCITCIKAKFPNFALIKDYLNYVNTKTCLFVSCENRYEMTKILIELNKINTYVNVWSMSKESFLYKLNYTQFFTRLQNPITVVINLNCEHVNEVLENASQNTFFHLERTWLMFSDNMSQSYNVLLRQNINMDAEISSVIPLENGEYQINDIYNPSKARGGRLNITTIGKWNQQYGIHLANKQSKTERRSNLGGLQFLAIITLPKPIPKNQTFIEHVKSNEYTQLNTLDRNVYNLFELMMKMYNFKVLIRRASAWIRMDPDGYWRGTVGMLRRGEVDVAISGLRHSEERYGLLEATSHCYFAQVKFIFKHPKLVDTVTVFVSPFQDVVWLVIILLSLSIAIALRQSFLLGNQNDTCDCTYSNAFLMVFGILMQQGSAVHTFNTSTRLFTITILVFSIVIIQFYSSFILASLLIEAPKTIKTLSQLLQSKLECVVDDVPYIVDNLKHAKDESAIQIYQQVMQSPKSKIVSLARGLDLVKQGGYAWLSDGSYVYPKLKSILSDSEICSLHEVELIRKLQVGPGIPKKSPLRELIKISLCKFYETGILSHNLNIWMGKKPQCEVSNVDLVQVDWAHFSSAVYVLLIGIKISVIILLGEILVRGLYIRAF